MIILLERNNYSMTFTLKFVVDHYNITGRQCLASLYTFLTAINSQISKNREIYFLTGDVHLTIVL